MVLDNIISKSSLDKNRFVDECKYKEQKTAYYISYK